MAGKDDYSTPRKSDRRGSPINIPRNNNNNNNSNTSILDDLSSIELQAGLSLDTGVHFQDRLYTPLLADATPCCTPKDLAVFSTTKYSLSAVPNLFPKTM